MPAAKILYRSPEQVQASLASTKPRLTSVQPRILPRAAAPVTSAPAALTPTSEAIEVKTAQKPVEAQTKVSVTIKPEASKAPLRVITKEESVRSSQPAAPAKKAITIKTEKRSAGRVTVRTSTPEPVAFTKTVWEVNRLILVPVIAVVLGCATLIALAGNRFEAQTRTLDLAEVEGGATPEFIAALDSTDLPQAPEAVETDSALNSAFSNALALFSRDRNSELSAPRLRAMAPLAAVAKAPAATPFALANIEDMKSKIKFIAGLIAMHRPTIANCGEVAKAIVEISTRENIDPFYVAAVISIESRFANSAVSSVGARGLMQIMPDTASFLSRNTKMASLSDTHTNINLGVRYLKQLEATYRGDKSLALSAYNWGPGNVDRAKKGFARIPTSVKGYAKTIIDRSKNWADHYRKAKESASSLDQVVLASS